MKIKTKITLSTVSALTLGILCYSVAFPAAANDQVKTVPTKKIIRFKNSLNNINMHRKNKSINSLQGQMPLYFYHKKTALQIVGCLLIGSLAQFRYNSFQLIF